MRPEYVDAIPRALENGVFYIAIKGKTSSHLGFGGCGTNIVTPLRETEYKLFERGKLISLDPSIGNWNHPCQSHYWIRDNKVIWAEKMSPAAIRAGRVHDDAIKAEYFERARWPWWRRMGSRIRQLITGLGR